MPVREPDAYLSAAVESILRQTHESIELLLVCKETGTALQDSLPGDSRLRLIRRDEPDLISALNTGIREARGDYIARMDSDDIARPDRLETQLAYLQENPSINIAGAHVRLFNADGALLSGMQHYQAWLDSVTRSTDITQNIFVESPLPHPTFFAKADVFRELGYRDSGWAEDYDFLLRAFLLNFTMGKPKGVLLEWREHTHRLTHRSDRYSTLNFIRAKAWALSERYPQRSIIICGLGSNAVKLHDALVANGMTVTGFIEHDKARPRTSRRSLPVMTYSDFLQTPNGDLVVSAVSARGARDEIRSLFTQQRMIEGEDFIIAA